MQSPFAFSLVAGSHSSSNDYCFSFGPPRVKFERAIRPLPSSTNRRRVEARPASPPVSDTSSGPPSPAPIKESEPAGSSLFLGSTSGDSQGNYRLLIGRELRVAEWMIQAYEELGRRSALLDCRERELLGTSRAFKIMELRERSMRWTEKRAERARKQYDFSRRVKELFADDLARDMYYKP